MTGPWDVSFVITSRDETADVLDATVRDLISSSEERGREIIVVDDGSLTPVDINNPSVQVVRNSVPWGVSRSRRRGAEIASGNVLVWLDAHMRFAPDWLDQMLAHVESGSLLCSAFWDYDLKVCHCWGADYAWCGERDYWNQRYPGFGLRHRVHPPQNSLVEVPMVIGACYMIARSSYERLGGFSPFFRVWGIDEQDISARAWIQGIGVKCVTNARVGHLSRSAFPYPVQFEHLEFNQLMMIQTVFEAATIERLQQYFEPIPRVVREWIEETDVREWRSVVQAGRSWSDEEFFRRFSVGF